MRFVSLAVGLVASAALAACSSPADEARVSPAPTGPVADDADSLAARLVPGTLAPAFDRLARTSYTATVVVEELGESGERRGRFERTQRYTPRGAEVLWTNASGTLADTSGLDPERLRIADPLPDVLADTPAYVAPATREQYAVRAGPVRGSVRQVDVQHTADTDQAVERVSAVLNVATGDVLRIAVARQNQSAIYDEATRTEVRMQRAPGGPVPQAVETTSIVSTPLSGTTTYRVSWRIALDEARRQGTNTRNP